MARRPVSPGDRAEALRAHLRTALLSGQDTVAIRRDLAAAEAEEAARVQAEAAEAGRAEQAESARLAAIAAGMASAAVARIAATIAALEPPPAPWGAA